MDEKPERLLVTALHDQVARLLVDPAAVGIRRAGDVLDPSRREQCCRKAVSTGEEVAGEHARRLRSQGTLATTSAFAEAPAGDPASSSTLRTEVGETGMPRPLSSPLRLYPQRGFSSARRRISSERAPERRPSRRPARVCPPANDELAVPAKQCLRLDREDWPGWPGQRTLSDAKSARISPRQLRPRGLPTEDRQLVPKDEDLQLLRATRPSQQPYQREQVPGNEIHQRANQPSLDHGKRDEPSEPIAPESRGRVCEPYDHLDHAASGFLNVLVSESDLKFNGAGGVVRVGG